MGSSLEFRIDLTGNFAGALEKNAKANDEAEKHVKKHRHELELFEVELGKAQAGALGINFSAFQEGGHFLTFDLAEGAKMAYEAIEKVVDKVIELGGEMIKAAADAQDLNLAISLDVGEEGAEKVDELAESFSNSRFSPKQIKEALLPILEESGNEHQDQWNDLVTAASDVATRRKSGIAGTKQALIALNDIELNPQRLRGSLKELGIKQHEYYTDLGKLLGISQKEAEERVKAGKVASKTLLSVALNQIAQREGGALGNATNEGSKTLGASIERLANLKDNLFEQLAGSKGMAALQSAIDTFVETMQGPVGTDLMNAIDGAFVTLFGDLSGPEGAQKLQAIVEEVTNDAKDMIQSFREAWPEIKEGAADAWEVFKGFAATVKTIVDGWRDVIGLYHDIKSGQVLKDIKDTITGEHGGIATDAVNDNSPAWKKARAAGMPVQGNSIEVPQFAGGGVVDSPTLAIIGEAGPEAVVPLGKSFGSMASVVDSIGGQGIASAGGKSIVIGDVVVNVTGGGNDAHEFGQSIGDQVREELKKFVQEIAA